MRVGKSVGLILGIFWGITLWGCQPTRLESTQAPLPVLPTPVPSQVTPTLLTLPSPTPTQTYSPTPSPSPMPTETPTAAALPPVPSLRVKVIAPQVVCHYGPGKPYLYKYALIGGSNLEAIARVEWGDFLQVRAIGGTNPCWVNPEWVEVNGDPQQLQAIPADEVDLPYSPYYAPLTGVSASRQGSAVTIIWNPVVLRAGDDLEQVPYLLEAWLCQAGEYRFLPLGSYQPGITIQDEPGCSIPSHARILAAEKHGYTRPVEIPGGAKPRCPFHSINSLGTKTQAH